MASEDSSFNSSGDTVVAFATINSLGRPAFGVSADADVCGVYGQSASGSDSNHSPTAAPPGTGVFGRGDFHGVYGVTGSIDDADTPEFGSFGIVGFDGSGVVGVNNGNGPAILADNGILQGDESVAMDDLRLQRIGVAGMTRVGPGVVGVSLSGDLSTDPHIGDTVRGTEFTDGTNVHDAGVEGLSMRGPGVRGVSRYDRGGVFESARGGDTVVAQLRLYPAQQSAPPLPTEPHPPQDTGEAGDLLALNFDDGNQRTRASLWFCVGGASTFGTAIWVRIV